VAVSSLKTRLLGSFIGLVLALSGLIALLGYYVIQREIVGRVDAELRQASAAARSSYASEIDRIGEGLRLVEIEGRTEMQPVRSRLRLHYLVRVEGPEMESVRSDIARLAVQGRGPVGGTRLISRQ